MGNDEKGREITHTTHMERGGKKMKLKQYNEKKKGRKKKEICNLFRTSERQNAT